MLNRAIRYAERHANISFLILVLVFMGVIFALSYSILQNRDAISRVKQQQIQSAQQQKDLAQARQESRANFRRSDVLLCRAIERLKGQQRATALENYRNLDRNLRLLGIKKTPEIVALAKRNLRQELHQNMSHECGELPSVSP